MSKLPHIDAECVRSVAIRDGSLGASVPPVTFLRTWWRSQPMMAYQIPVPVSYRPIRARAAIRGRVPVRELSCLGQHAHQEKQIVYLPALARPVPAHGHIIVGIYPRFPRVYVHGHGRDPVNRTTDHTGPATRGPRVIVGQNCPRGGCFGPRCPASRNETVRPGARRDGGSSARRGRSAREPDRRFDDQAAGPARVSGPGPFRFRRVAVRAGGRRLPGCYQREA